MIYNWIRKKKNIQESILFAYTLYVEPLSLMVLEAISLGLPVIVIREGCIWETIKNSFSEFLINRDYIKKIADSF